jgi:excisionase family DNA binding protein
MATLTPDRFYDPDTGSRLLTTKEAAVCLSYHPYSVYRLVLQGDLRPHRKAGKTLLFLTEDLERYKARHAWASRKGAKASLPKPSSAPPLHLTATVAINVGFDLLRQQVVTISDFTWDQVPLIHARTQEQYGQRPSTIEVKGPDGGTWRIDYEPPTWLAQIKRKIQRIRKKG